MSAQRKFFKSLYFGDASAEAEAEKWPNLFLAGFLDVNDVAKGILAGDHFLLIGPKGVGKSSYAEFLHLSIKDPYRRFVNREDLGELRGALKTDLSLSESGAELNELAWSTWIWCRLFDSLMGDQSCSLQGEPETIALYGDLKKSGIATGDYRAVIQEVRKKRHKFTVPKIYEVGIESDGTHRVNIGQLRDLLANIVTSAETPNDHVLALDGLDSAEIGTPSYWKQLGALLRATTAVHRRIRSARATVRVCLLCRSDVFLKIPIPDSNKIRQSWGVDLKWEYGLETPEDSPLWDMLEKKASARGTKTADLLETYFPKYMIVGQRTAPKNIRMAKYLLDLTRSTPRDIVMLMKFIQGEIYPEQELNVERVRAGVNSYCKNYFANEIVNELVGMTDASMAERILGAMTRLPSRRFTREQFIGLFSGESSITQAIMDGTLQQLYLAGAIANFSQSGAGEEYVKFYHRRSYAELDLQGPFLLHNALTYGLNVRWSPAP
ncbi:hypothetical protein BJY16_001746 [Actinoplanes octamycinicus]|uniref:Uncharacterized protein n=1 Tax=Actinoplanes octamycinicus TaxID=135948 RepID=A0A7W7M5Z2_9ACTN|nr:hypothetical protein [Actinoplanes octamycinicus]MBB4738287.1 hypothetical protein [Actinoplanes octamycinicus]GIE57404.1 hypothetical protein Aoc01nite_28060 [Actinoplanes octamycinicus]